MLHPNRLFLVVSMLSLAGTLVLYLLAPPCQAQEMLEDPQLQLSGRAGQTVIYSVGYFHEQLESETVHARIELPADGSPLEPQKLQFGYSGMRIEIAVASAEPFTARLLDGENVVSQQQCQAVGTLRLEYGLLPASDPWSVPRALLNGAEQQWVADFVAGMRAGEAEPLVSSSPIANIDWQTLSAYFAAVKGVLGQPLQQDIGTLADGWIGWEGSLGARVLSGPVTFEKGRCDFKLMLVDGQLVDVVPNTTALPEDWFEEPPQPLDIYIQRAHSLARALLAGNVTGGQLLFSPRYHEELTLESLRELSGQLRLLVDDHQPEIVFQRSEFLPVGDTSYDKRLRLHSVLTCPSGQRCLSQVDFIFPSGAEVIGRGHLASIHIREAWTSAAPALASQQSELLAMIGTIEAEAAAVKWLEKIHPQVKEHISPQELASFIAAAAEPLGQTVGEIDFDQWQASAGAYSTAVGPVEFATAPEARVQSNWLDGHWLGITLLAENFAASTHDLVPQYDDVQELSVRFWERLFEGNFPAAHACLAEDFQRRLSVEQLQELFEDAEFGTLARLRGVVFDRLRIADRDQRPLPVILTAYCIAEFEDGSYIPVSCEFTRSGGQDANTQLLNFSTDVSATFPLATVGEAQMFWEAFSRADSDAVRRLVSEAMRARIQPEVLTAFLLELQQVLGSNDGESSAWVGRTLRIYDSGRQLLQLNRGFAGPQGRVDVVAAFERGELRDFQFIHPTLETFVQRIENQALLDNHAQAFVEVWLSGDTSSEENAARVRMFLASELNNEVGIGHLVELHRQLLLESGVRLDAQVVGRVASGDANRIELELRVQLERGERTVKLTYAVNAFAGWITQVEVMANDQ